MSWTKDIALGSQTDQNARAMMGGFLRFAFFCSILFGITIAGYLERRQLSSFQMHYLGQYVTAKVFGKLRPTGKMTYIVPAWIKKGSIREGKSYLVTLYIPSSETGKRGRFVDNQPGIFSKTSFHDDSNRDCYDIKLRVEHLKAIEYYDSLVFHDTLRKVEKQFIVIAISCGVICFALMSFMYRKAGRRRQEKKFVRGQSFWRAESLEAEIRKKSKNLRLGFIYQCEPTISETIVYGMKRLLGISVIRIEERE